MSKKALKDKKIVARLIEAIGSKKYNQANKYLMAAVDHKIKTRVNNQLNKPLFQ